MCLNVNNFCLIGKLVEKHRKKTVGKLGALTFFI